MWGGGSMKGKGEASPRGSGLWEFSIVIPGVLGLFRCDRKLLEFSAMITGSETFSL